MVLHLVLEVVLLCHLVRKSVLNIHWKDWCWSWNSNTLATWCEELTHLKRPWCWDWLMVGGEAGNQGWDGWMASPAQWTWIWVSSGSWWWTGRPGVLQSMGMQRVRHDWVTELSWNEHRTLCPVKHLRGRILFPYPQSLVPDHRVWMDQHYKQLEHEVLAVQKYECSSSHGKYGHKEVLALWGIKFLGLGSFRIGESNHWGKMFIKTRQN